MKKIKIGVIANTHALKGELKVKSFSEFNDVRYAKNNTVYIDYRGEMIEVVISSYKEVKQLLIVKFKGLDNINDVEKYKGCEVYIDESQLHELESEEVYFFDLMDCEVYDESNNLLGVVEDVLETGANAVLRVNKTILIPYVNDFILSTSIKDKKIVIKVMEGLI